MKQSRRGALTETVVSIAVGFCISYAMYLFVLPAIGFPVTGGQALGITVLFTITSLIRSYGMRRLFEHLRHVGMVP